MHQTLVEEPLQIARDLVMRDGRRGHHHGHTSQQFPALVIGPPGLKGAEFRSRHPARSALVTNNLHGRHPFVPRDKGTSKDRLEIRMIIEDTRARMVACRN
jgi:hypothetical protein